MNLRQRRRLETERAIVAEAMRLLAVDGLEGLSMRKLAKGVGCTEPALYRYFASKDALLAAMTACVVERLGERLERALGEADEPLLRVALVAEIYAAVMTHRRGEGTLLTLVLGDPRYLVEREASAPTVEAAAELFAGMGLLVDAASKAGAFAPGDAVARALSLWTAAHGAAQLRKFDRFDLPQLDVTRVRRSTLRDLFRAWGASPSAIDAAFERAATLAHHAVPPRAPNQE